MQTKTLSTLVAVFRTDAEARAAADDLRANGFSAGDIFVTAENTTGTNTNAADEYRHHEGGIKGWFHSVFGENQSETDAAANEYERAVSTGNVLVSLETNETDIDRAADILNRHSPVDVHRDVAKQGTETSTPIARRKTSEGTLGKSRSGDEPKARTDREQAIPVVHEQLEIGKRTILRGGVRVYSRVVEQPVEETVNLREERVRVDRTPVNRETTEADLQRGREKVIEVKEFTEEPVVAKRARVVEEIRVGKEASERQETIRDTVRHTEVRFDNLGEEIASDDRPRDYPDSGFREDFAYRDDFQRDFEQRYANSGASYDEYAPAYEYGYLTANDPRYRGRSFDQVESDLREDYGRRYPNSTWERMKDSVRYGWNRLTHRHRGHAESGSYDDTAYRNDFRRDFEQRYANAGGSYDEYAPAYEYGYQTANDPRYSGRNFDEVESDLREDYGRRYPNSAWERMKDSVRYGWNRLTRRV